MSPAKWLATRPETHKQACHSAHCNRISAYPFGNALGLAVSCCQTRFPEASGLRLQASRSNSMTQQQTNVTALLAPPFHIGMSGSIVVPCLWMPALLPPQSQVPMLAAQHLLPSVSVVWVQPAGNHI